MKKAIKISALIIVFCILLGAMGSCSKKLGELISIIIATDMHYISSELLGDGSFFSEGSAVRNDGKVVHYSAEITDTFLREVIENKPKALILRGDLTINGSESSHKELIEKLKSVKGAGIDVLVIPGNHDAGEAIEVGKARGNRCDLG